MIEFRESCIRENRPCSLSGGRRPAPKRASSDPTPVNQPNQPAEKTCDDKSRGSGWLLLADGAA